MSPAPPRFSAVLAAALLLAGCGHAATARFRPADGSSGVAEASGVRLTARAEPWHDWPDDLQERLTPIWIRLENHGTRALWVGYGSLQLQTDKGLRYIALAPRTVARMVGVGGPRPPPIGFPPAPPGMIGPPVGNFPPVAPAAPDPGLVSGSAALDTRLPPGAALEGRIFFRAAAVRVRRFALTAELAEDGTRAPVAVLRLDFARAPAEGSAATPPRPAAAPPPGR